jgi:hypothetical protein
MQRDWERFESSRDLPALASPVSSNPVRCFSVERAGNKVRR